MNLAHEVFISYGSPDKAIANAVCARLEGRGVPCRTCVRGSQEPDGDGSFVVERTRACPTALSLHDFRSSCERCRTTAALQELPAA